MGLTLNDCVRKAYENNVTVRKSFQALDSTATFPGDARGRFDPVFFSSVVGTETISPSTSILDAGVGVESYDQDNVGVSTGFTGTLYSGATYTLSLNYNRTYNPESVYLLFNPIIRSDASIEVTQPLLKGGWTTFTRAEILTAELNTSAQAYGVEIDLNEIIYQTVEAYWNMVFAFEDLKVKEKSLELAEDLLRINTRKKEEGVFSKMEVLEASADVAIKEEELITARNAVLAAEDRLKHLIFPFASMDEWEIKVLPLTEAAEATDIRYDLEELIAEAEKNRADFQQLRIALEQRELDLLTARNQLMPSLDLRGKWGYLANGSNYGNALDDIYDRKFRYFQVGLEFSFPLGNRTARSAYTRAEIDYQQALTSLEELRIQIAHELRDAMREVELQRERINATRESFRLSRERYEGEKKRLEAGMAIPYQVREAERNLSTEAAAKTRALLDYQVAIAMVAKVKGSLLAEYRISTPADAVETRWAAEG